MILYLLGLFSSSTILLIFYILKFNCSNKEKVSDVKKDKKESYSSDIDKNDFFR